jgi:hypothetical protein
VVTTPAAAVASEQRLAGTEQPAGMQPGAAEAACQNTAAGNFAAGNFEFWVEHGQYKQGGAVTVPSHAGSCAP